jgi:hypothetical protein
VLDRESGVELQLWKYGIECDGDGARDEQHVVFKLFGIFEQRFALGGE